MAFVVTLKRALVPAGVRTDRWVSTTNEPVTLKLCQLHQGASKHTAGMLPSQDEFVVQGAAVEGSQQWQSDLFFVRQSCKKKGQPEQSKKEPK